MESAARLLGVRHAVIQSLKGRHEFGHSSFMGLDDRLIGFDRVDRGHCLCVLASLLLQIAHRLRVVSHHLHEAVPLGLLGGRDVKLVVQLLDVRLDRIGLGGRHRRLGRCRRGESERGGEHKRAEQSRCRKYACCI